jgi:two-component system sensor histidine kinase CssS
MKKFKFKTLTMRIWTTFIIIILIVISGISLFYLAAFKKINENAKVQDLLVAHDILLKSNNFDQPNRFDEMRNLIGSSYFIYNINENNSTSIINIKNNQEIPPPLKPNNVGPPLKFDSYEVQMWMTGFIKTDYIHEKQYISSYKNIKFIFVISSVNYGDAGKSYLITYMPVMEDNSLLYMVLVIGAVFILISFIASKTVASYLSKPLKELEKYTVRIAHKDWKEPISLKYEDEIGRLASSMNIMQEQLKQADEEEKLFLQSISHDLKTPVMVIMSHADAIIDGVYIETVEKTAEIIKDEAVNLEKRIKQILYLNTLEYTLKNKNADTEIDLRYLVANIINRFEVVKSEIEWKLDLDEVVIIAEKDKIQVSIENIMENSLRYVREEICVSLKKQGSFVTLEIYNDGPNIDKAHMEHIFDNFYKDKTGNFGLGLAISKRIINFYHGEISAVNREKGVSFIIQFPLRQQ